MATSKAQVKSDYPLPVYNYRVEIGGEAIAFSEVSGLSLSYGTTTYKESPVDSGVPGPRVMRMPAQIPDLTVSLKKGVVQKKSVPVLYNWIASVQTNQVEKRDVVVTLLDETGSPVIVWTVLNAFPTKLEAPTFDANSDDVAIESMELMADRITMSEG